MDTALKEDLDRILKIINPFIWDQLQRKRIFITGGTGFFGIWLLESLSHANEVFNLNMEILFLTRNPKEFEKKPRALFSKGFIDYLEGNVKDFQYPRVGFDYIIHAAAESSERLNNDDPLEMMDTIVGGTRNVLEFGRRAGVKRILFISSGAVYGRQPNDVTHITEDILNVPDTLNSKSAYAESKRLA